MKLNKGLSDIKSRDIYIPKLKIFLVIFHDTCLNFNVFCTITFQCFFPFIISLKVNNLTNLTTREGFFLMLVFLVVIKGF